MLILKDLLCGMFVINIWVICNYCWLTPLCGSRDYFGHFSVLIKVSHCMNNQFEPPHTKPAKWLCTQQRLRSAWASAWSDQCPLSAWRKLGCLATHWVHSEDSDQTGQMPRLIWVFAGHTVILLVLPWGGSFVYGCNLPHPIRNFHNPHCHGRKAWPWFYSCIPTGIQMIDWYNTSYAKHIMALSP